MAKKSILGFTLAIAGMSLAQKPEGTEVHPKLTTYQCTLEHGCVPQTNYVVLDSLSHSVHQQGNTYSCSTGYGSFNSTVCSTEQACAQNCVMDGITDYSAHGVVTNGASLLMEMFVNGKEISPRIYLLDESQELYDVANYLGGEFSFDVDMSKLPCGMNSALYLVSMAENGGQSTLNPGGAYWGTGYCDAQCGSSSFINGVANLNGSGACCNEMDIWEANSRSAQLTPHTCSESGLYECSGSACGSNGVCDKNGCAWNPYHFGETDYYGTGPSFQVNTLNPFTVVTQFLTDSSGVLTEIKRIYVQAGKVIQSETIHQSGLPAVNGITDAYCTADNAARFEALGGMKGMGNALKQGMVMAFSIWWDAGGYMNWLDAKSQGAGPCNDTEGSPTTILKVQPSPVVTFSNLKWGELNSTYSGN